MSESYQIHDEDWVRKLQDDFAEYMELCWQDATKELEDGVEFTTISGQPFCGCEVCETRETLAFFIPRILTASQEGKITLEE